MNYAIEIRSKLSKSSVYPSYPNMFNKFVNIQPTYWKPTFAQIQAGGFVDNQQDIRKERL